MLRTVVIVKAIVHHCCAKGGFFSQNEIKGLALPKDVLEKIYYKNAMRIYPRVKQNLQQLGYSVE